MRNYLIYVLIDTETLMPFYVGITSKTLAERLAIHMWCAKNRPYGDISSHIKSMSKKPAIKVLESLENVSSKAARIRELFWFNNLKQKGFELKNLDRPYKEYEPPTEQLSEDEILLLRNSLKYLTSINRTKGQIIRFERAKKVSETGNGNRQTLEAVRKFLSIIRVGEIPNFKNKYSPCMVTLSGTEIQNLSEWKKSVNMRNLYKNVGVSDETINRALKSGQLRRDKYSKISRFINNT